MQCLLGFIVGARKGRNVILCLRRDFARYISLQNGYTRMRACNNCDAFGIDARMLLLYGGSIVCDQCKMSPFLEMEILNHRQIIYNLAFFFVRVTSISLENKNVIKTFFLKHVYEGNLAS